MYIIMTDSHPPAAETKATLSSNFPPLTKLKKSTLLPMIKERELAGLPLQGLPFVLEERKWSFWSHPNALSAEGSLQASGVSRLPTSEHFVIGAGGRTPIHHAKLDWRTNGARTQMLLPMPPINEEPSLWFQQPALRRNHRASADVPGSESQTGGLHRAPEKGHRPSPEFHHLFPPSAAVSCMRGSFICHCWKFLKCYIR